MEIARPFELSLIDWCASMKPRRLKMPYVVKRPSYARRKEIAKPSTVGVFFGKAEPAAKDAAAGSLKILSLRPLHE
jgi:hypothetical protein